MSLSASLRRPWPLWFLLSCFLVAVVSVPLVCHRPRREPRTLEEFTASAEQRLGLHVVVLGKTRENIYLCRQPGLTPERLATLTRQRPYLAKWSGIVLVTKAPTNDPYGEQINAEWGDACAVVDGLMLWGDPALVAELVRVMTTGSATR